VATHLTHQSLADIQGFITSGYGHLPLATYLFLRIGEAARAQAYLATLIPSITTSTPWPVTAQGAKVRPLSAVNVGFTAAGLQALGLPEGVRCTFPCEFHDGIATSERSAILGDTEESAPDRWEFGGPAHPAIHIVLIVHGASSADLDRECGVHRRLLDGTAGGVTELASVVQSGYRPQGGHEPFGFHDGVSQPSIKGIAGEGVPTGEFILGYTNHYDVIPPTPVVPEALEGSALLPPLMNPYHQGVRDLGLNGSYVVYRKLQQDVAGFWRFMRDEALRATSGAHAAGLVWLASRCMGRWPSGAPLAITPDRDDPRLHDANDFLYDDDADGLACPTGAHIRRTNPRAAIKPYGPTESLSMSEAHRLLRRGRMFGPPLFDAGIVRDPMSAANATALGNLADDGIARGIHFLCVNASIKSQFEFVQQTWCNNPRFSGLNANKDPISGDNARSASPTSHMTIPRREGAYRTAALPRFVTVKAGAYLFMPSITALRFFAAFRLETSEVQVSDHATAPSERSRSGR
jgi:Dyp-type peroxidase family